MLKNDHMERKGNDRFEGFLIDLMHGIADKLKFDFALYESPDGNYGSKDAKTGEWNGMIRELIVGVSIIVTIYYYNTLFHTDC